MDGEPGRSGVWPAMHTNTSRILTAFSDLDPGGGAVFPSNHEILRYLHRYAEKFDLTTRIRFATAVTNIRRDDGGWLVITAGAEEKYERVVVATGRFRVARRPGGRRVGHLHGPGWAVPTSSTATQRPIAKSVSWWRAAPSALWRSPPN